MSTFLFDATITPSSTFNYDATGQAEKSNFNEKNTGKQSRIGE
ncbi:MAG: hypothetical protein SCJ94_03080 [Bacillota bacterium]|nr:hypothetical protein [Bacillota bacterium]